MGSPKIHSMRAAKLTVDFPIERKIKGFVATVLRFRIIIRRYQSNLGQVIYFLEHN
jgi:hypothetical protein